MPKRIQLRRSKGWRLPGGAVVVARPSRYGNPFRVERFDRYSRKFAISFLGRTLCYGFDSRDEAGRTAVHFFGNKSLDTPEMVCILLASGHRIAGGGSPERAGE